MITGIRRALEDNPAIPGKSLREQFDKLMLRPLLAANQGQTIASTMTVIDALGKCKREEDVGVILELLLNFEKATGRGIRFFLTSRPESPIRLGFGQIVKATIKTWFCTTCTMMWSRTLTAC
ncbi:hypothetical protein ASPSYDRAFT_1005609 [Aspergillus sydowii CBS 593.65]|uniref:Nephrocystin 3-like N-terminal domain-containing protein n=1 Tax=Aspergillus sydowii CBS 593.65 TaxID=1036612 RepID=A0A1L9SXB9_9EURO|nr:uncharacterized protein ASPSYDRAFT_1005609 [Aspergillus sydowii CBS 593.65]OJJ51848.1 hypothetical protein ASPSYDRAFT_1005609 [Aspergillus sydowii CBS 593.65]